jgi:hypothetical protein
MAIGNLQSTGAVAIGDAAGVERSLNIFKNVKHATRTREPDSSVKDLLLYFQSYVKPPGDVLDSIVNGAPYKMSETRGLEILHFQITTIKNESPSKYHTNNDAGLAVRIISPVGRTYTIGAGTLGSVPQAIPGGDYYFGGGQGTWDPEVTASQTITIIDNLTQIFVNVTVTAAYDTGASYITTTDTTGAPAGRIIYAGLAGPTGSLPIKLFSGRYDAAGRYPNG